MKKRIALILLMFSVIFVLNTTLIDGITYSFEKHERDGFIFDKVTDKIYAIERHYTLDENNTEEFKKSPKGFAIRQYIMDSIDTVKDEKIQNFVHNNIEFTNKYYIDENGTKKHVFDVKINKQIMDDLIENQKRLEATQK